MSNGIQEGLRSWGLSEKCPLLLEKQASLVDPGKKASPFVKGLHLKATAPRAYSTPDQAQKAVHSENGIGNSCQTCPYKETCQPQDAAINESGRWKPAVRPGKPTSQT